MIGRSMHLLTRGIAALAVASLAFLIGGCNKSPAEAALAAAEDALAAAGPEIEKYAPEELAPLADALRSAHAAFEEGRYTDALRVAQEMPTRIEAATAAARAKRDALAAEWGEIAGEERP